MRYERESWRKLYREEPFRQRAWPVMARGLRDYLVRQPPDESGTLIPSTDSPVEDLTRVLGPTPAERPLVLDAVQLLLADGYLCHDQETGRLWIRNYRRAQTARSKDAIRKAKARAEGKRTRPAPVRPTSGDTSGDSPEDTSGDTSGDTSVPNPIDETRRDETRRDENPPKSPTVKKGSKRGKPRGKIPEDWKPSEATRKSCLDLGLTDQQIEKLIPDFVDFWLGEGEPKADWEATFRSRVRRWLADGRIVLERKPPTTPEEREKRYREAAARKRGNGPAKPPEPAPEDRKPSEELQARMDALFTGGRAKP